MERLDKILSAVGVCSRNEAAKLVRRGLVTVNGEVVGRPDAKIGDSDVVTVDGERVELPRRVVCMMNKPVGFVTSTRDPVSRTVMEILPKQMLRQNVVPVGRLDKDTEGLLLFTNDGELLHRLTSPKHNVRKVYLVEHENDITDQMASSAAAGIVLRDGTVCKGAAITRLGKGRSSITVTEGMYHQIKRMYGALGCHVNHLVRLQIGALGLGGLPLGETRELSEHEIGQLLEGGLD